MRNKDIEKTIYESFNEKKPELFNKILEQCPEMTKAHKTESKLNILISKIFSRKSAYSFATASLVVILALVLFQQPMVSPQAFSTIAIDVNPSVVLEVDEDGKVINVIKNNEDAEIIIGDMDLIGVDYNIAINAIIGSMVTNGYINELTNSVLLSIQSNDAVREGELMAELTQAINDVLTGNSINGSVITQELDFDGDAEDLAELLDISEAKAELILDIIEADPRAVAAELALLSINDLNLYLEAHNIALDNVQKTGEASVLGIITVEESYQIALTEIGLDTVAVLDFEIDLEQEDGTMVYEIKIETETEEYEILVDAKEGTVFVKTDDDDDTFPVDVLTEEVVMNFVLTSLGIDISLISELEIDKEVDNGIAYYEIEFEYDGIEYELEVDALTGEVYTNSTDETGFDHQNDEEDSLDEPDEDELDEEDSEDESDEDELDEEDSEDESDE